MSAIAIKIADKSLMADARQTFESAIAQLQPGGARDGTCQTAIRMHGRPTISAQDAQATEKQALTDASRALARLWHVSPTLIR